MPSDPKAVLFAYSSPTVHHGSPRVLVDIVTGLDKERFCPIFVCPKPGDLPELLTKQGIKVVIAPWRSITKTTVLQFCFDILYFWFMMKRQQVGLLHMNEVGWRDSIVIAARLRCIPIILHLHVDYQGPIKTNWNFRLASCVIVVAEVLKEAFANEAEIYKKLVTVHNGLDLTRFEQGGSIRAELGLPENAKVIGYVGQIVKAKGLKVLVDSAKSVLAQYPETVFLFVGRRVAGEEGLTDELMQLAKEHNIFHALRFIGPRDDIPNVMKSLDVLVLPTLGEAFGMVILEGMGAGISVVASRVGGIPEIIVDGVNGLLVEPGDVQALGEALLRLLGDSGLRNQLGAAGLKTVRDRFSVQHQIDRIENIYDGFLA